MLRGSLHELPVGSGSAEICPGPGTEGTTLIEGSAPAAGTGFYFLVRGTNACGMGSYGFASSGAEQASAACP